MLCGQLSRALRSGCQLFLLRPRMDAHERGLVADAFKEKDLEDGEAALTEGESVNNLYIVQEGTMQGGDDADAVHFGPGEFFGELALVLDEPIEMTVSSLGETFVWFSAPLPRLTNE